MRNDWKKLVKFTLKLRNTIFSQHFLMFQQQMRLIVFFSRKEFLANSARKSLRHAALEFQMFAHKIPSVSIPFSTIPGAFEKIDNTSRSHHRFLFDNSAKSSTTCKLFAKYALLITSEFKRR